MAAEQRRHPTPRELLLMALHHIKKGLDLPISGAPEQKVGEAPPVTRVALVASDYHGMKARMHVQVGDSVKLGQLLFEDRKRAGVRHTSPGSGRVTAINRGARRALQSVVITLDDAGQRGEDGQVPPASHTGGKPEALSADQIRALLVESGLWTALRTRPFSRQPEADATANAIFITAIDTDPLAADVAVTLAGREEHFAIGATALAKLTEGRTYICRAPGSKLGDGVAGCQIEEFSGPHPAGLAGTHIHILRPVDRNHTVWHVSAQDTAAIGALLSTGRIDLSRVISVAGPAIRNPRLVRTRVGAAIDELVQGRLADGEIRVVSGSVLSGCAVMNTRILEGRERFAYLGRFDRQISALAEGRKREFLGWLAPGLGRFSTLPTYLSALLPSAARRFALDTGTNGSPRAMVPIGMYERVFPLDILPTFLLRSITVEDIERAELLGVLELDEEDLALCTTICPGKVDYGPILRRNLDLIEREG